VTPAELVDAHDGVELGILLLLVLDIGRRGVLGKPRGCAYPFVGSKA
jgi:hypothetical protein